MTNTHDWARPVFHVNDLAASLRYYSDSLGFNVEWVHGGPDHSSNQPADPDAVPAAPIVAGVERNGIELILDQTGGDPRPANPSVVAVELHAYGTLRTLHEQLEAAGAIIVSPPYEVRWAEDTMQLDVADPDGNVLMFWGNFDDESN